MSQSQNTPNLQAWLVNWPTVRNEIKALISCHAERDPGLHFELTLAELELKDLDEAVKRVRALSKLLCTDADLTSAELQATGNL
jgi:hypothetical protein